jgi:hypothetical protein
VALLFKSSPEVLYIFQPFRWESLEYGTSWDMLTYNLNLTDNLIGCLHILFL